MLWQGLGTVKPILRYKKLIIWLITGTFILLHIYGYFRNNFGIFITYPKPFSLWVSDFYGTANAEDIADLEAIVNLIISFLVVSIFTFIFLAIKKKLTKISSGR